MTGVGAGRIGADGGGCSSREGSGVSLFARRARRAARLRASSMTRSGPGEESSDDESTSMIRGGVDGGAGTIRGDGDESPDSGGMVADAMDAGVGGAGSIDDDPPRGQ